MAGPPPRWFTTDRGGTVGPSGGQLRHRQVGGGRPRANLRHPGSGQQAVGGRQSVLDSVRAGYHTQGVRDVLQSLSLPLLTTYFGNTKIGITGEQGTEEAGIGCQHRPAFHGPTSDTRFPRPRLNMRPPEEFVPSGASPVARFLTRRTTTPRAVPARRAASYRSTGTDGCGGRVLDESEQPTDRPGRRHHGRLRRGAALRREVRPHPFRPWGWGSWRSG